MKSNPIYSCFLLIITSTHYSMDLKINVFVHVFTHLDENVIVKNLDQSSPISIVFCYLINVDPCQILPDLMQL